MKTGTRKKDEKKGPKRENQKPLTFFGINTSLPDSDNNKKSHQEKYSWTEFIFNWLKNKKSNQHQFEYRERILIDVRL